MGIKGYTTLVAGTDHQKRWQLLATTYENLSTIAYLLESQEDDYIKNLLFSFLIIELCNFYDIINDIISGTERMHIQQFNDYMHDLLGGKNDKKFARNKLIAHKDISHTDVEKYLELFNKANQKTLQELTSLVEGVMEYLKVNHLEEYKVYIFTLNKEVFLEDVNLSNNK